MATLNRVYLIGRLTRDPELKRVPSGDAVTELCIAVNRSWIGKDGNKVEESVFLDVSVWGPRGEACAKHLAKGRSVLVEGSLKQDSWEDRETGQKRSKIRIQADRVEWLDEAKNDAPAPRGQQPPTRSGGRPPRPPREPAPVAGGGEDEDSIPF